MPRESLDLIAPGDPLHPRIGASNAAGPGREEEGTAHRQTLLESTVASMTLTAAKHLAKQDSLGESPVDPDKRGAAVRAAVH